MKITIATEEDLIKAMKRSSRELYGFEAPKIFRNKKKYNRKDAKRKFKKELEQE